MENKDFFSSKLLLYWSEAVVEVRMFLDWDLFLKAMNFFKLLFSNKIIFFFYFIYLFNQIVKTILML